MHMPGLRVLQVEAFVERFRELGYGDVVIQAVNSADQPQWMVAINNGLSDPLWRHDRLSVALSEALLWAEQNPRT